MFVEKKNAEGPMRQSILRLKILIRMRFPFVDWFQKLIVEIYWDQIVKKHFVCFIDAFHNRTNYKRN